MPAYATVADLQDYYDWREIGDLVSDSKSQISAIEQREAGSVYNSRLLRFLERASGEIEAAIFRGGRYNAADLASLTGNSLELLRGICCEFVVLYLMQRKPMYAPEKMKAFEDQKRERLRTLQSGEDIFPIPKVVAAGVTKIAGPTTIEYQGLNLVTDRVKGYPPRALPNNR